jgi:hypothetical protein
MTDVYFITITIVNLQVSIKEMESIGNVESIARLNHVAKSSLTFPRQKISVIILGVLGLSFLDPLLLSL